MDKMLFRTSLAIVFVCVARVKAICQPPDVPVGGSYSPVHVNYLSGEQVEYSCDLGFLRTGMDILLCENDGNWSDPIPFCDPPTPMENPWAVIITMDSEGNLTNLIDGDTDTCYSTRNSTHLKLEFTFEDPLFINTTRLYVYKGNNRYRIITKSKVMKTICTEFSQFSDENKWIVLDCRNKEVVTYGILIYVDSVDERSLDLCEVEIFDKNDSVPVSLSIPKASFVSVHNTGNLSHLVDGDNETCLTLTPSSVRNLDIKLSEKQLLYGFRIFLHKGYIQITILSVYNNYRTPCFVINGFNSEDRWFQRGCYADSILLADTIVVQDDSGNPNNMTVCEVQAFVKNDLECQIPPTVVVKNGHLEVSREKASLRCDPGFVEGPNKRLVCRKNGTWSSQNLQCYQKVSDKEENKKGLNIIAISAGIIGGLMLISCIGISVYFISKPKEKEVVVVMVDDEDDDKVGAKSEPEAKYYEIRNSFYEKKENDYYETPVA